MNANANMFFISPALGLTDEQAAKVSSVVTTYLESREEIESLRKIRTLVELATRGTPATHRQAAIAAIDEQLLKKERAETARFIKMSRPEQASFLARHVHITREQAARIMIDAEYVVIKGREPSAVERTRGVSALVRAIGRVRSKPRAGRHAKGRRRRGGA